ncbi:L,D-transpeptidase [Rhodobacteraceae bacterium M382]|nr:L,D-transpeptidase [Rhodobacteraceae bacterium M382]
MKTFDKTTSRRQFLIGGATTGLIGLATPGVLRAQQIQLPEPEEEAPVRRNVSSFRAESWQDHFDTLKGGVILSDTTSKMLQFWSEDESVYKVFPTSVPLSEDLTRLGYTKIIRKVDGPSWAPTPSMKKRNPEWPDFVGPGPENPLGTHALYLSWQYYRIHGTNDTRKIGRKSSNGCIGLYNEQIAELFALTKVGTQVKLI